MDAYRRHQAGAAGTTLAWAPRVVVPPMVGVPALVRLPVQSLVALAAFSWSDLVLVRSAYGAVGLTRRQRMAEGRATANQVRGVRGDAMAATVPGLEPLARNVFRVVALAVGVTGVATWAMSHGRGLSAFVRDPVEATRSYARTFTLEQLALDALDFGLTFIPGSALSAGTRSAARSLASSRAAVARAEDLGEMLTRFQRHAELDATLRAAQARLGSMMPPGYTARDFTRKTLMIRPSSCRMRVTPMIRLRLWRGRRRT
ncbi:hypothetical protein [Actinomyces wuliandei]|uniref:hypothetical protein n=1 Tax=Actinomyces wuliandei TaxID=2057743 RepID=UPI001118EAF9|nr:hypothetical protein [Actinomyces wuliandei]